VKTVLIIDDHADLRRLVSWSLEMLEDEITLLEAKDGTTGLALAHRVRPDLVLLDVMMPGELNGLEVCRRIRADTELSATRVVLLSARGQASDVKAGLEAGAHSYMVKPFSPQRLLDTATQLLAPH
jgi:DNA-binding response OmpR family regulator